MARPRYFVSYVERTSLHVSMYSEGGSVPGWNHKNKLVNVHPVLWAAKHEKVIVFWSEIPESVYQEVKALEAADE